MPAPGVNVISRSAPPNAGASSARGAWMVAGITERGPVGRAVAVHNMKDYGDYFGSRTWSGGGASTLYDPLDAFFQEGGDTAYVSRVVGSTSTIATVTFNDSQGSPAPSIIVTGAGPGAVNLSAAIVAGLSPGSFAVVIYDTSSGSPVEVERSPDLTSPTMAAGWSVNSRYVAITAAGTNNPATIAVTAIAGGNDQRTGVTDTERSAAFNAFNYSLGFGQVSYPGGTTAALQAAILNHAQLNQRTPLLDAPDSGTATTLNAAAAAIRAAAGLNPNAHEWGAMFAPWVRISGIVNNTTRTVPPSAIVAGLIARKESSGSNPNSPAAGDDGVSRTALSLSQNAFSDTDRQLLNDNGVNLFRDFGSHGGIRLYGYRTLALKGVSEWFALGSARVRAVLSRDLDDIGEQFMFAMLDGHGIKVREFGNALAGVCKSYYDMNALYGDTADEAYSVDVGPTVNTPTTLAANELHAVVGIKISPFAEQTYIEIVKVPLSQEL
jgi:phage tail sheath protein FI